MVWEVENADPDKDQGVLALLDSEIKYDTFHGTWTMIPGIASGVFVAGPGWVLHLEMIELGFSDSSTQAFFYSRNVNSCLLSFSIL